MNRIQFFVLIGLSSLLVLLIVGHLVLLRKVNIQQANGAALQQALTQGREVYQKLTLLAKRVNVEVQKTPPNTALKDILTREQINIKNVDAGTNATDTATPPSATK